MNWLFFLIIGCLIGNAIWHHQWVCQHLPTLPTMTGYQAMIFGFACAFTWAEVLKWWPNIKPFNCLKCMCGWLTLIIAFMFHVELWPFYLPVGLTVGAVFEGAKMRWL